MLRAREIQEAADLPAVDHDVREAVVAVADDDVLTLGLILLQHRERALRAQVPVLLVKALRPHMPVLGVPPRQELAPPSPQSHPRGVSIRWMTAGLR